MKKKYILYLRTDICDQELTAGGSVAHTVGVISGFISLGYSVICASSSMHSILEKIIEKKEILKLSNPEIFSLLRWKLNCFLSSYFFFVIIIFKLKNKDLEFIYQRYSLLNMTGVLLAWWYKKKFILEYNGSEVWIVNNWSKDKRWIKFEWLMKCVELINIHKSDAIVVVSEVLKKELIVQFGIEEKKILVNPNGVDISVFRPYEVKDYANNYHIKKELERHTL